MNQDKQVKQAYHWYYIGWFGIYWFAFVKAIIGIASSGLDYLNRLNDFQVLITLVSVIAVPIMTIIFISDVVIPKVKIAYKFCIRLRKG